MNIVSMLALLVSLRAQLAVLQQELLAMQNATSTAQVMPPPVQYAPPVIPVYVPPVAYVAPVVPYVAPAVAEPVAEPTPESCTLTVVPACLWGYTDCDPNVNIRGNFGRYTWSSTGVPTSTSGTLYVSLLIGEEGGPTLEKFVLGKPITSSTGSMLVNSGYTVFQQSSESFILDLDHTSCETSWVGKNPDGSQYVPG